jgi:hypothetical protein
MTKDDAKARHKRAASLRKAIERLKDGDPATETPDDDPGSGQESPRDFVERRAIELDEADDGRAT